jgi:integrase
MLPWRQMPPFMAQLRAADGIAALALEFTVLTAARGGEVRHATWNEIDLRHAVWTVPAGKMKENREHAKPLPARALELLAIAAQLPPLLWDCGKPGIGKQRLVFPGTKGPLSDMSMAAVLKRGSVDATVHGMRRSFRTWCGDSCGGTQEVAREIAEMCLAHAVGNEVERAYNASTYLEQRRLLLDRWAGYCAGDTGGGSHGSQ